MVTRVSALSRTGLIALAFLGIFTAALPSPRAGAQPVSEVEVTADGLHRIDPEIMATAWLRPDADFERYTRALVMPTVILFREMHTSHSAWADNNRSMFPVSEPMRDRLRETFGESFHEIMGGQRVYEVTDGVGRDVVLVHAYLTDVATGMPLDLAGSNVNMIRWVWEGNLIVELRDSMSDDVLFRAIERQRVEGPVDADTLWGLAPRVTRDWSRVMIGHIEDLATFYPSRLYRLQERARSRRGLD